MTTAIIGVGNIGKAVAQDLVNGGEEVVLASRKEADAAAVADGLGSRATAASTGKAIDAADVVVLAVWLDAMKEVIADHGAALAGKVVIDPSNPVAFKRQGRGQSDATRRCIRSLGHRWPAAIRRPLRQSIRNDRGRFTRLRTESIATEGDPLLRHR